MLTSQFTNEHLPKLFERLQELSNTKGKEYRRTEGNVFANFARLSEMLDLRNEQVLMVYFTKHLDAIAYHVATSGKQTYSEPITGRIEDAILYLCLLHAMTTEHEV